MSWIGLGKVTDSMMDLPVLNVDGVELIIFTNLPHLSLPPMFLVAPPIDH